MQDKLLEFTMEVLSYNFYCHSKGLPTMSTSKYIFVFRYGNMGIGGVQAILYGFIRFFLNKGADVVWIAPNKPVIYEGYSRIVNRKTIIICNSSEAEKKINELYLEGSKSVILMSFNLQSYCEQSILEQSLKFEDIRNFYVVAHYKGNKHFLEQNFYKYSRLKHKQFIQKIYTTLINNKSIFFCAKKQIESFEQHYQFSILNKKDFLLPTKAKEAIFNEDIIENRYNSKVILSISRMDFPHKSYVLGLIDAFSKLKDYDPELKLVIIGDGNDAKAVRNKIKNLSIENQKDITLIPSVPFDNLIDYFNESRVFVGLAGALGQAASSGLVSIIARHYCPTCQVYGSYALNSAKVVSEDEGIDVIQTLKEVLSLNKKDYYNESLQTFQAFEKNSKQRSHDITLCRTSKKNILEASQRKILQKMTARYFFLKRMKMIPIYICSPIYTLKRLFKRYTSSL